MLDIVIFTCESRTELLKKTWMAFADNLEAVGHRRILAADGQISLSSMVLVRPDVFVQNYHRMGYIQSIRNALSIIQTDYFLWLEDDWEFRNAPNIAAAVETLEKNPSWIQLRWSKSAPLAAEDALLADGIRMSSVGFSANPCVCRTDAVRQAFHALVNSPKGNALGVDGFENVITRWAEDNRKICAVFDPGEFPAVIHNGDLETTGRAWHMTRSIVDRPDDFGFIGSLPPLRSRCAMVVRLVRAFLTIAVGQLYSAAYYEFAFRIVHASKKFAINGSRKQIEK